MIFHLSFIVWLFCVPPSLAADKQINSPGKSLSIRISAEPETLDWNIAHTMIESYILMNLMEGLLSFDDRLKVKPALAEKWTKSSDGKTYTFYLKKGVKWSDGVALTAHDFLYSWQRLLSPNTAASYAYLLFDIVGAEDFNKGKIRDFSDVGIKAVDPRTLQVSLRKPVAYWDFIPTFWVTFPLRKDIVEKHGSAWPKPGRMVTVGPFNLASHDINSQIVLRSNPQYHGDRGNLDEVNVRIIQEDSTALNLYETGKLDFLTDISTLDLKRMEGRSDLKTFPYLKTGYLAFAVNKYPANDVKIRRAVAMAIDKSKFGMVLHGGQKAATSFVPPPLLSSGNIGLPFKPQEARDLLKSAGWTSSRKLQLELLCANWDKSLTLAEFVQGQLKTTLGIDVSIQPFDHKTFRAQLDLYSFPMSYLSWGADYPDPDNFLSVFLGGAGNNRTQWANKKYDELVIAARYSNDQKAREKMYIEAQKILIEKDAAIIPLYYEPNKALVRSRVVGLKLNPMNYLILGKVSVR